MLTFLLKRSLGSLWHLFSVCPEHNVAPAPHEIFGGAGGGVHV